MSCKANLGASVEGEKLLLKTRKFYSQPPTRSEDGVKSYPFKLSMHGHAHVEQPYADPEKQVHYTSSMTEKDSCIHGETVSGWSLKRLKEPNVSTGSGTHSAAFLSVGGGCFAKVDSPPRDHQESEEIRRRHPAVELAPNLNRIK